MSCVNADNSKIATRLLQIARKAASVKVPAYSMAIEAIKVCKETIKSGEHARELQLRCEFLRLLACSERFLRMQLLVLESPKSSTLSSACETKKHTR
jgi:hypothetical protein